MVRVGAQGVEAQAGLACVVGLATARAGAVGVAAAGQAIVVAGARVAVGLVAGPQLSAHRQAVGLVAGAEQPQDPQRPRDGQGPARSSSGRSAG